MTWLKLSDDFGDDCARARLSDAAFRTHVEGLLWTMRRETAGRIDDRDIRRFAESDQIDGALAELLRAGFWRAEDGGYAVLHHMNHQADPEVIARRRELDAERQRRARRKKAGLDQESDKDSKSRRDATRDERADIRDDNLRDPGLVGAGLDGKPQTTFTDKEQIEEHEAWPSVVAAGSAHTDWADAAYDRE